MNLLRETRVLAILCIVASAAVWASGCVGVGAAKSSTTTAPSATSIVVSPATAAVAASGQTQFTASIQGVTSGNSVTWTATIGTITTTGIFTAPAKGGTGTITATSVVDPTKSTTVAVTVAAAGQPSDSAVTSVIVSPASGASITGGTVSFSASVLGTTSNTAVTWKALLGTITAAGVYTAPAKAGTDTVTATSVADATKFTSSSVTVTAAAQNPVVSSIAISPTNAQATTSGTLQFAGTVQGSVTDKTVRWIATSGTVNSTGMYTASTKAGTDTVTAISNADPTKTASATVTVTAPVTSPSQSASCGGAPCPAFPGAAGGGAASVGGRGGVVMEVTNTNDTGNGSLRACVQATGARTCVFRVAGIFNITSGDNYAGSPFLTIACQSAPGEAIIGGPNSNGVALRISTHDVVMRYCTFQPGQR